MLPLIDCQLYLMKVWYSIRNRLFFRAFWFNACSSRPQSFRLVSIQSYEVKTLALTD